MTSASPGAPIEVPLIEDTPDALARKVRDVLDAT